MVCSKVPSTKDVRRDGGRGFGQMRTHADRGRGVNDLADVRKLVLFFIVSACFADTLSVDMPIKVQIVIHLIRFAPQSIIWAGTEAYIQLITLRVRLLITWPKYQPTWGRSKICPDDINEQRILTAPAITLSQPWGQCMMLNADVRKGGGDWSNADTCGQRGGGVGKGVIFCGRPLWTTP